MPQVVSMDQLKAMSLSECRSLFRTLEAPAMGDLPGTYRASFVGPAWLRRIAGPGLAVVGLRGWWGKVFWAEGGAANLVLTGAEPEATLPIAPAPGASRLDARSCLVLTYPPESRPPWPWVVDELRKLDDDRLLGMTMVTRFGLSRISLPFLLQRVYGAPVAGH